MRSVLEVIVAMRGTRLSASERQVLCALAMRASDDGIAWPSAATVASDTGLGERQVRALVKSLEAHGLLVPASTRRDRSRTDVWRLVPERLVGLRGSPPRGGRGGSRQAKTAGVTPAKTAYDTGKDWRSTPAKTADDQFSDQTSDQTPLTPRVNNRPVDNELEAVVASVVAELLGGYDVEQAGALKVRLRSPDARLVEWMQDQLPRDVVRSGLRKRDISSALQAVSRRYP